MTIDAGIKEYLVHKRVEYERNLITAVQLADLSDCLQINWPPELASPKEPQNPKPSTQQTFEFHSNPEPVEGFSS